MAEGPFANAGLGAWGLEKSYMSSGMTPPKKKEGSDSEEDGGGILGKLLGGLIGLSPKASAPAGAVPPGPVAMPAMGSAPQQYDLPTAFPEVLHQQYASPYAPAYTPVAPIAPPSMSSLPGFQKPAFQAAPQPNAAAINNLLWGG